MTQDREVNAEPEGADQRVGVGRLQLGNRTPGTGRQSGESNQLHGTAVHPCRR